MWNLHALRTACALDPRFVLPYPDTCTLEEVLEAPTDDGNTDDDRVIFNPPPSVSTTAFPTAATVFVPYNSSTRTYCASANAPTFAPTIAPTARPTTAFPTSSKPHLVRFDAEQVRNMKVLMVLLVVGASHPSCIYSHLVYNIFSFVHLLYADCNRYHAVCVHEP